MDKFNADAARKQLRETFDDADITKVVDGADDASIKKMISRMTDGVHLGTPVFDGAREVDVKTLLRRAQVPENGQMVLFDGRTGEPFHNPVTVGVMYMLKLQSLG